MIRPSEKRLLVALRPAEEKRGSLYVPAPTDPGRVTHENGHETHHTIIDEWWDVLAVGKGVELVSPGDRVAVHRDYVDFISDEYGRDYPDERGAPRKNLGLVPFERIDAAGSP